MADKNKKTTRTVRVNAVPYNEELEKIVLATIMTDTTTGSQYVGNLKEDDFYIPKHKAIFREIYSRSRDNNNFDYTAIMAGATTDSREAMGDYAYLAEVANAYISSANFDDEVKQLKSITQSRRLIAMAENIKQMAFNNEDAQEIVMQAQDDIYNLAMDMSTKDLVSLSSTATDVFKNILDLRLSGKKPNRLSTGYPNFDEVCNGGFLPGQMIVLAARPGCGKTSFAMSIVANIAKAQKEKVVAVFNLEMSQNELTERLFSSFAGINSRVLANPAHMAQSDLDKLIESKADMISNNVYIDDSSNITVDDIMFKCKKLRAEKKRIDLVLIDHMQLIKSDKGSRYEQITEISRMLKVMAKELQVPVLVLSQMSRNIEKDNNNGPVQSNQKQEIKIPKMSDLRESGSIEQDADMVVFLVEGNFVVDNESEIRVPLDLFVAKNRSGSNEISVHFAWQKDMMRFDPKSDVIFKNLNAPAKKEEKSSNNDEEEEETISSSQPQNDNFDDGMSSNEGLVPPEEVMGVEGCMGDLQSSANGRFGAGFGADRSE